MKPIPTIPINPRYKAEWAMREEGSYEDSKRAAGHVYELISRKPKGAIKVFNQDELVKLSKSAGYCCMRGNGEPFSDRADKAIEKICNELNSLTLP